MRKYDNEFKQQAVKKILDGQLVASVSGELGVAEGVLHNWKKAKLASGSGVEQEVVELKKRLREVEMERERVKKGGAYLRQGRSKRYRFIESESPHYPIKLLCRVMEVTRSCYYAYLKKKAAPGKSAESIETRRVKEC